MMRDRRWKEKGVHDEDEKYCSVEENGANDEDLRYCRRKRSQ
jgi:hypothetical protein